MLRICRIEKDFSVFLLRLFFKGTFSPWLKLSSIRQTLHPNAQEIRLGQLCQSVFKFRQIASFCTVWCGNNLLRWDLRLAWAKFLFRLENLSRCKFLRGKNVFFFDFFCFRYKGKYDQWVPLCPQTFFQSAVGEIHICVDYTFIPDEKTLEEQHRLVELNYQTVELVISWFREHPEALKTEGLFRVPGRLLAMQEIWNNVLEQGPVMACLGERDDHVSCLLFKMSLQRIRQSKMLVES
jgi:hypothetical protein